MWRKGGAETLYGHAVRVKTWCLKDTVVHCPPQVSSFQYLYTTLFSLPGESVISMSFWNKVDRGYDSWMSSSLVTVWLTLPGECLGRESLFGTVSLETFSQLFHYVALSAVFQDTVTCHLGDLPAVPHS